MKFLIAVGSQEYSGPTLRVGMEVAAAFYASVTVVKVGPRISEHLLPMSNWLRSVWENGILIDQESRYWNGHLIFWLKIITLHPPLLKPDFLKIP